jgi:hypothetical protein
MQDAFIHIKYLLEKHPESENSTQIRNAYNVFMVNAFSLNAFLILSFVSTGIFSVIYGLYTGSCIEIINKHFNEPIFSNLYNYANFFFTCLKSHNYFIIRSNLAFLIPIIISFSFLMWFHKRFPFSQFKNIKMHLYSLLTKKDINILSIEQINYFMFKKVSLWETTDNIKVKKNIVVDTIERKETIRESKKVKIEDKEYELIIYDIDAISRLKTLYPKLKQEQKYRLAKILYESETIELIDSKGEEISNSIKLRTCLQLFNIEKCVKDSRVFNNIFFNKSTERIEKHPNSASGKNILRLLEQFKNPDIKYEKGIDYLEKELAL